MQVIRRNLFPLFALCAFAPSPHGRAQTPMAASVSPFLPANAPATDLRSLSREPFQLSAIGIVGGKTFVSIYETAERKGRWVAVGGSLGDLQVVSCDVEAEQAVVRIGGQLKTLSLPKPAVSAAAPAASPDGPAAGAAPATTEGKPAETAPAATEEEQAREARMLVSDLLEIGVQQRKAYEDAQKKAAEQADKDKPRSVN